MIKCLYHKQIEYQSSQIARNLQQWLVIQGSDTKIMRTAWYFWVVLYFYFLAMIFSWTYVRLIYCPLIDFAAQSNESNKN